MSRCDLKIDNKLSRSDRKIVVEPQENPKNSIVTVPISRLTAPTGERKKITNKVHEGGGSEGTVDARNANKCGVLLVVHKGIEIKGVVGFKSANNQNGLACSDSNSYRMLGTVVDVGGVSVVGINITATKNSNNRGFIIVVVFDETCR